MIEKITEMLSSNELLILIMVLAITFVLTELLKQMIRHLTKMKEGNICPRLIGFSIGFMLTIWAWPEASRIDPVLMALFIGAANPAIYRLVRWKWPKLSAVVTGKKPADKKDL